MKAVILAGGVGTRLWPMSRKDKPKQFFEVVGEEPLICDTYRRLLRLFPAEKIYFSISPTFDDLIHRQFPDVPDDRILIEPEKRDTGPAMGYVAALLELTDPDEPIVFIPSDHYINDEELFLRCLDRGGQLIEETGKLLDIGIAVAFPSTVLGYTKIGELFRDIEGIEVFAFAGHKEKPDYQTAKSYLESGNYLWHANYYMWTPRKFMEAFEKYAPDMGSKLRKIQRAVADKHEEQIFDLYTQLPKISIDYAITEKMHPEDVLIIKGDFGWSDIGAWDTLYDRLADSSDNVVKGKCVTLDTTGSLIYGPAHKLLAVVGMKDIVVVDTGDALLICPRGEAQRVKEIVEKLQDENHETFL
ncbi:NTP transferase domain-containing protein [Patescibacteria group bacterium]|nr:NTP transferase domain-containing protein [Patescibacteria group bacterium]